MVTYLDGMVCEMGSKIEQDMLGSPGEARMNS